MRNLSSQQCLGYDWSNKKDILASEIADSAYRASEDETVVFDEKYQELQSSSRKKEISTAFRKLVIEKQNTEERIREKNLIEINSMIFEVDDFSFDEKFIDHKEAFTVAMLVEGYTTKAALRILKSAQFKDPNHHNRDIQKINKEDLDEFEKRHTINEYLKVCTVAIKSSLIEYGTPAKRAHRTATKATKIIKQRVFDSLGG